MDMAPLLMAAVLILAAFIFRSSAHWGHRKLTSAELQALFGVGQAKADAVAAVAEAYSIHPGYLRPDDRFVGKGMLWNHDSWNKGDGQRKMVRILKAKGMSTIPQDWTVGDFAEWCSRECRGGGSSGASSGGARAALPQIAVIAAVLMLSGAMPHAHGGCVGSRSHAGIEPSSGVVFLSVKKASSLSIAALPDIPANPGRGGAEPTWRDIPVFAIEMKDGCIVAKARLYVCPDRKTARAVFDAVCDGLSSLPREAKEGWLEPSRVRIGNASVRMTAECPVRKEDRSAGRYDWLAFFRDRLVSVVEAECADATPFAEAMDASAFSPMFSENNRDNLQI